MTLSHFPSGPLDVSFESEGMHGWKLCESHEEKKRPNWYFSMGITNSPNTGPKQDHTSGSGTAKVLQLIATVKSLSARSSSLHDTDDVLTFRQ